MTEEQLNMIEDYRREIRSKDKNMSDRTAHIYKVKFNKDIKEDMSDELHVQNDCLL